MKFKRKHAWVSRVRRRRRCRRATDLRYYASASRHFPHFIRDLAPTRPAARRPSGQDARVARWVAEYSIGGGWRRREGSGKERPEQALAHSNQAFSPVRSLEVYQKCTTTASMLWIARGALHFSEARRKSNHQTITTWRKFRSYRLP